MKAHNVALLCKFLCKTLQTAEAPCFEWLSTWYLKNQIPHTCKTLDTPTWRTFSALVPLVQFSTACNLGSGRTTSFWFDKWTELGRLYLYYPVLFSFATSSCCTVASQYDNGWQIDLHPHLSHAAMLELQDLLAHLDSVTPMDHLLDARSASLANRATTYYFYKLNTYAGATWEPYPYVWNRIIPKKHSIFLWLAFRDRLNTRSNMIKKQWKVCFHAGCESFPAEGTISHIILRCKEAQLVWRHLNLEQLETNSTGILGFAKVAAGNTPLWNIAFAGCMVTLWDIRNAKIFEGCTFC